MRHTRRLNNALALKQRDFLLPSAHCFLFVYSARDCHAFDLTCVENIFVFTRSLTSNEYKNGPNMRAHRPTNKRARLEI